MSSNLINKNEIRKFGLVAFVFFGCLAGVAVWKDNLILKYFFGCLSVIGLGLVLLPGPLAPVYNGWLRGAHFISKVVTFMILVLAYYLVMTPSAVIKRIFGGRPLPLKPSLFLNVISFLPRNPVLD